MSVGNQGGFHNNQKFDFTKIVQSRLLFVYLELAFEFFRNFYWKINYLST